MATNKELPAILIECAGAELRCLPWDSIVLDDFDLVESGGIPEPNVSVLADRYDLLLLFIDVDFQDLTLVRLNPIFLNFPGVWIDEYNLALDTTSRHDAHFHRDVKSGDVGVLLHISVFV